MNRLTGLSQRLRSALRRGAIEAELDEEIRLHLDLETERNIALGMEPGEARRRALAAFGGGEATKEAHRDGRVRIVVDEACLDELNSVLAYPEFGLDDAQRQIHLAAVDRSSRW